MKNVLPCFSHIKAVMIMLGAKNGYLMINRQPDILIENLNNAKTEAEGEKLARIENIIKQMKRETMWWYMESLKNSELY